MGLEQDGLHRTTTLLKEVTSNWKDGRGWALQRPVERWAERRGGDGLPERISKVADAAKAKCREEREGCSQRTGP